MQQYSVRLSVLNPPKKKIILFYATSVFSIEMALGGLLSFCNGLLRALNWKMRSYWVLIVTLSTYWNAQIIRNIIKKPTIMANKYIPITTRTSFLFLRDLIVCVIFFFQYLSIHLLLLEWRRIEINKCWLFFVKNVQNTGD